MVWAMLVGLTFGPVVEHTRKTEALTRYGVGLLYAHADRPVSARLALEAAARAAPQAAPPNAALAPLYQTLGRPAAALRVARAAVAADPDDFATGRLLGQLLTEVKRHSEAVAVLKTAAASPRLTDAGRKLGVLADLAQAATNAQDGSALEAAARTALPLCADDSERSVWNERLGRGLEWQNQLEAATQAYRAAVGPLTTPTAKLRLNWLLSGVLRAVGRNAEALAALEIVLAGQPTGAAPYERLADLLTRLRRSEQIPAKLAAAAAADPANAAINWIGADALAGTDPASAATRFRELADAFTAPREFPRLVRFHLGGGPERQTELLKLVDAYSVAARMGRLADGPGVDALDRFRTLVDAIKAEPGAAAALSAHALRLGEELANHQPDTRDLLLVLADSHKNAAAAETILLASGNAVSVPMLAVLKRQRKWVEVLELCDQAESTMGRRTRKVWDFERAEAYLQLGRGADALAALDQAARLLLDPTAVQLEKARVLTGTGRAADAVQLCEKVLAERPAGPVVQQARLALADAHNELGQFTAADEQYELCLEDDPDSVLVLNNYAYNLADRGRRLPEAEDMICRAIELNRDEHARSGSPDPARGTYLDSLGWVQFRRGQFAQAVATLEAAATTSDSSSDGTVWDHLGDARLRAGDTPGACTAWTRALEFFANTHQGHLHGRRDEINRKLAAHR